MNNNQDAANDSNVAQTRDDQDMQIRTKKRKVKMMITGTTQKLMASAIMTLEGLPDWPMLLLLRTIQDAGLKLLLHANGPHYQRGPDHKENKENMVQVLFTWLGANDHNILQLLVGFTCAKVPPMG